MIMPFRPLVVFFSCTAFLSAADGVYQAPSPEPTPEEVAILQLINRCRADPPGEGLRIAPLDGAAKLAFSGSVDFKMFRDEMSQIAPAPPLVFDLRLLDAARKHAHYMILHGLGHDETPGKAGFTGTGPSERARAAGWSGGGSGENAYRDAPNPEGSHNGFVVDFGPGGPGGMQPARGHRKNICSPGYRAVGPGAVPHSGRLSVVHVFGGSGQRFAGGITYVDRNHNGVYDAGEGRGGVVIQIGDERALSWSSGAFTIAIPASAGSLVLKAAGQETKRLIPAGDANVTFEWVIPQEQELAAADKLIAAVTAIKDPASLSLRKARVALLLGAQDLALDDDRRAQVKTLIGELGDQLDADQKAMRALFADPKAFAAAYAAHSKPWRGTAAENWFKEADLSLKAKTTVDALLSDRGAGARARDLAKELRSTAIAATSAEFRAVFSQLADRTQAFYDRGGK